MTELVRVQEWGDLVELPLAVGRLADGGREVVAYAERWVCQRGGFEPSPVCVLRPLADAADRLAGVFADLGLRLERELGEVAAAVRAAGAGLGAVEDATVRAGLALIDAVSSDQAA